MEKDIIWFDLESTGINTATDRVIEICMIKKTSLGKEIERFQSYVNPEGMESRPEAIEKHGITPEMLADKPTFKTIAKKVNDFIGDCDLGGYNILYFDIPLLTQELFRSGIPFNHRSRKIIDPFLIQTAYEPRDLSSTYQRMTGKVLENAHAAEADIEATIEIFDCQKAKYSLPASHAEIEESSIKNRKDQVDLANRFKIAEIDGKREIVFNFGKNKGKIFKDVFSEDASYIDWMINKGDFALETKIIAKKLVARIQKETFADM